MVRPRPGMAAIDLACGTGQWTRRLAAWGLTVTGIDSCDKAIVQAQTAGAHPGLRYMHWNIVADPIPAELAPGQFDIVTCRYGLAHLEPGRLLTDVGRWLKPDGIFYALVRVDPAPSLGDRTGGAHHGEQLAEVSRFPDDVSEEYVRHLGAGWAYRAVHKLRPHRRVIVLSEYGIEHPKSAELVPGQSKFGLRPALPSSQDPAQDLPSTSGDHS
ncbi:class I SAM-dependent methyltransferase [Streptomyces sp. CdTB01]|uniref:class I SAM-dependent methyltransferase n=1 Tax=Streptomyces sp. CdTB01 TaxID=1725411 RepID=UPI0023AF7897|nr:class I SAM-dependent methyltransferase [Streptomyces sp. CdTB01]